MFSISPTLVSLRTGLKALALLALLPAAAGAAEITQTHNFSYSFTGFDNSAVQSFTLVPDGGFVATFNPFDPSQGTLVSSTVAWAITVSFNGIAGAANSGYNNSFGGTYSVNGAGYSGNGSGTGANANAIGDVLSASFTVPQSNVFTAAGPYVSDPAIYAAFVGASPFTASWDAGVQGHGSSISMTNITSGTLSAIGTASVTYAYEAVPEPASALLLVPALGLLATWRRRRA